MFLSGGYFATYFSAFHSSFVDVYVRAAELHGRTLQVRLGKGALPVCLCIAEKTSHAGKRERHKARCIEVYYVPANTFKHMDPHHNAVSH